MNEINELESARRLQRAVDELPRELRPAHDLWPEIADRLEERPRLGAAGGWWQLAAAMILLAVGLLAAMALRPEMPGAASSVAARPRTAPPALAAPHMRQRDGVIHAHNDLMAVAARRRGRLDAAGAAALTAGLEQLERATAEIEAALVRNPSDRRLRLALAAAYRREAGWTSRLGHV